MVNVLIKREGGGGDGVKDFIIKGKLMKSAVIRSLLLSLPPLPRGKEKKEKRRENKFLLTFTSLYEIIPLFLLISPTDKEME